MGPSYASLFVGYVEHQFFNQYDGPKPDFYGRYIDDCIGAISSSREELNRFITSVNSFHTALKYTWEISETSLAFLDIKVSINGNGLRTSVHYKPTDSHSYLLHSSSHPSHADKISGPKRSVEITDRFTCTSANVIYCITCTLCKKLNTGETGKRLGDRFREHLRDVKIDDKDASKPVARHFNLPNHSKEHMSICGLSLHQAPQFLQKLIPLTPKLPNLEHLQKTERAYKLQQAENYNKRHRSSVLPELNPGDKVWIPDKNSPAVVIQKFPQPRSYVVKTEQSLLRRNRRHLIPNPKEIEETAKPLPVGNIQPTKEPGSTQGVNTPCSVVKTRSGRTVLPPTRLDL
ncbi:hypothetical protein P5673_029619 [Acropora cervicornis]|uniref:Reverse transcriptase domain-containing protein n=1 Tax=Acropora cervicornis TaxID=6130 RepID=A0AAD9UTX7_ACRCE|nr:hypothetical protein P5673_029619 [Acropora cervicornis]